MEFRQPIYPVEPWSVTEPAFSATDNYRNETTFALSNGYIGTRGTFEESYTFGENRGLEGTFINGFCDSAPIRNGEWSYGFPEHSKTMLNLPNMKTTRVYLDGEVFDMRTGHVEDYKRTLDLRGAKVTRSLKWTSPGGSCARIDTVRFVSFVKKNIMVQRITVTPLDFNGETRLLSVLNADVESLNNVNNPLIAYGPHDSVLQQDDICAGDDFLFYSGSTTNSGLKMACGSLHVVSGAKNEGHYKHGELRCCVEYSARGAVTMDKFIAYASSLDMPAGELGGFIREALNEAANEGFETLAQKQKDYMDSFWNCSDVEIDGDEAMQQGIRFNLFNVLQSAGRDGRTGMGANGLPGEGYGGHSFWDTEIYVLPLFIHTFPDVAKRLLDYRYGALDAARERARDLGHEIGALYPWCAINGEDSSNYVPPGTAQYHINADIAYAFAQYVEVTGDMEYLKTKAAEVLCETARVWADVGYFSDARDGKYCICCVTGPDEYNAFVDNNFYTNIMARENLRDAVAAVRWLEENDAAAFEALSVKIGLRALEPAVWENIAENMYLPMGEKMGVFLPDDGFLLRKPWHDSQIPPDKKDLLYQNYHPLYIWRQRMAKQADSVLAMFLHSDRFSRDEMARNYDFYQEFTLHHSSLSTCVFGMVASAIGREGEAYGYFHESARMDLDDHHSDVYAGVHAAIMAGSWQAIVFGFAGLRTNAGKLELRPSLPAGWDGYRFRVAYLGRRLEVSVRKSGCTVKLMSGESLSVTINGKVYPVKKRGAVCLAW